MDMKDKYIDLQQYRKHSQPKKPIDWISLTAYIWLLLMIGIIMIGLLGGCCVQQNVHKTTACMVRPYGPSKLPYRPSETFSGFRLKNKIGEAVLHAGSYGIGHFLCVGHVPVKQQKG